jgi:hypothetical protein
MQLSRRRLLQDGVQPLSRLLGLLLDRLKCLPGRPQRLLYRLDLPLGVGQLLFYLLQPLPHLVGLARQGQEKSPGLLEQLRVLAGACHDSSPSR